MIRALIVATAVLIAGCGREIAPDALSPSGIVQPSKPASAVPQFSPPAPTAEQPYHLSCGPMEPAECQARALQIVASVERAYPTRKLVYLSFTSVDGDSQLYFDDGTALRTLVN